MTLEEFVLVLVAEECMEFAQRVTKVIRFGLREKQPGQEEDNASRMNKEWSDLLATLQLAEHITSVNMVHAPNEWILAKKKKILKYMEYSRELGILRPRAEELSGYLRLLEQYGEKKDAKDPAAGR